MLQSTTSRYAGAGRGRQLAQRILRTRPFVHIVSGDAKDDAFDRLDCDRFQPPWRDVALLRCLRVPWIRLGLGPRLIIGARQMPAPTSPAPTGAFQTTSTCGALRKTWNSNRSWAGTILDESRVLNRDHVGATSTDQATLRIPAATWRPGTKFHFRL